jgi:hypothetical protein
MTVSGTGFTPGTQMFLVGTDGVRHPAKTVFYRNNATLFATFNLAGAPAGQYSVVAQDGDQTATNPGGFTADGFSSPGFVEFFMSAPSTLRKFDYGTVTVDYENVGNTDAPAPLVEMDSHDALVRLPNQTTFIRDVGGVDGHVQFLAINPTGPAGILPPGAKGQITIYYHSLGPSDGEDPYGNGDIRFQLGVALDGLPVNWSLFQQLAKPASVSADGWNAIWSNFLASVGTNEGKLQQTLDQDATYLSQLGQYVYDVGQLIGFELERADDSLPGPTLASSTDLSLPAPGTPLTFSRAFLQPISGRYQAGRFGLGWTDNWDISATADAQGTARGGRRAGGRGRRRGPRLGRAAASARRLVIGMRKGSAIGPETGNTGGMSRGSLSLLGVLVLLGFHRLAEAVTFAVHLEDVAAMRQPVQ